MIIYSLVYYKHKLENHIFHTKNDVNNKMYPPWCYEKNILYLSEQAEFGRDLYKCDSDVDAYLYRYEDSFHLNKKEYKNHTYSHRFLCQYNANGLYDNEPLLFMYISLLHKSIQSRDYDLQ